MATTTRFVDADGNPVTPGEYAITDTRVHVTAVTRPNGLTIDQQDAVIIHTVTPAPAGTGSAGTCAVGASTTQSTARAEGDILRDAIEDLINDAGHIEHTLYDSGARTGAYGHEPGSDLYCPACWVHGLRAALAATTNSASNATAKTPVVDDARRYCSRCDFYTDHVSTAHDGLAVRGLLPKTVAGQ